MADPRLEVADEPGLVVERRVGAALGRLGLEDLLASRAATLGCDVAAVPVVVVPEVEAFARDSPAAADPVLVEALVDLLHDLGCADVVVACSADTSSRWAGNRDVHALADLLGYGYVTAGGRDYDIVDLGEDLVPAGFPPGSVLAGSPLSRTWLGAGFRIVVASNRTDEADGYALALRTVLRALPAVDEHLQYRVSSQVGDVVAALLARTPVDVAVVDAIVSCHGSGGARAPRAHATGAVLAATDPWLLDAAAARLMGLDPGVSPLFARAPDRTRTDAERLTRARGTWAGFQPPDPAVLASTTARDATPTWPRLLRPWLQVLDHERFPLASPVDERLNRRLAPVFADVDHDPGARALLVWGNWVLAALGTWAEAYRVLVDKDALRRQRLPLGFDPADHDREAFAAVLPELRELDRLLDAAPRRAPGLRWVLDDAATVFRYERDLPVPFDEFVAAVDVTRTISLMNDYVGGVVVPLEHDRAGRPVRQVERNRYLPQPNWVAVWGGLPIDVGKIEVAEYGPDHHLLAWMTVTSPNGSAVHDDGIVEFRRHAAGTRLTITGRQQFTLPPLLAGLDLDLVPGVRDRLVTEAYRTFFDRTAANLEATAEGRDMRIGRPLVPLDEQVAAQLPAAHLERLVEQVLDGVARLTTRLEPRRVGGPGAVTDEAGFVHVPGTPATATTDPRDGPAGLEHDIARLWGGLAEVVVRDLADLRLPSTS